VGTKQLIFGRSNRTDAGGLRLVRTRSPEFFSLPDPNTHAARTRTGTGTGTYEPGVVTVKPTALAHTRWMKQENTCVSFG
jgi:hypothetical protein